MKNIIILFAALYVIACIPQDTEPNESNWVPYDQCDLFEAVDVWVTPQQTITQDNTITLEIDNRLPINQVEDLFYAVSFFEQTFFNNQRVFDWIFVDINTYEFTQFEQTRTIKIMLQPPKCGLKYIGFARWEHFSKTSWLGIIYLVDNPDRDEVITITTFAHEILHVFNLGHNETDPYNIMYPARHTNIKIDDEQIQYIKDSVVIE